MLKLGFLVVRARGCDERAREHEIALGVACRMGVV